MSAPYSLSPRQAWIVRVIATAFFVVGVASLVATVATFFHPELAVLCEKTGCVDRTNLIDMAPDVARPALASSPSAQTAFEQYVARVPVRLGLTAIRLIDILPFALLMVAVSLALKRLAARRGDDLAGALHWLRRSAIAALLMVLATPIADSLEAMILFPGTPTGAMWYLEVEFRQLGFNMLLASAVFAVVWALDAGSRAERDLTDFV